MPIVFPNEAGTEQGEPSVLDEERERHQKRCERPSLPERWCCSQDGQIVSRSRLAYISTSHVPVQG